MASFFFDQTHSRPVAYQATVSVRTGIMRSSPFSIVGKIIAPKSRRRTKHLLAVDVNPVPMTGRGFFVVRRDDCSAP